MGRGGQTPIPCFPLNWDLGDPPWTEPEGFRQWGALRRGGEGDWVGVWGDMRPVVILPLGLGGLSPTEGIQPHGWGSSVPPLTPQMGGPAPAPWMGISAPWMDGGP